MASWPSNDRQDHHDLVVDVVTMTSQFRGMRAISLSHVAKHDNHVPVTPLIGSETGCHVDAMATVGRNHIGKNIKIKFQLGPFINLFMKAKRYQVGTKLLEIVPSFLKKCSGPLNCTFTHIFWYICLHDFHIDMMNTLLMTVPHLIYDEWTSERSERVNESYIAGTSEFLFILNVSWQRRKLLSLTHKHVPSNFFHKVFDVMCVLITIFEL